MLNQLKREGHASNRYALCPLRHSLLFWTLEEIKLWWEGRDTLLSTTDRGKESARETAHTAALDNQGIILLQQQMMREQDTELEELERTVTSTKVVRHFSQNQFPTVATVLLLTMSLATRLPQGATSWPGLCAVCWLAAYLYSISSVLGVYAFLRLH